MSLDLDAKSIAIGGAAVFAATQLFGGSKKTSSKSVNGLGKPASKRKASGTKKASTAKTKKSTASKGKSKK